MAHNLSPAVIWMPFALFAAVFLAQIIVSRLYRPKSEDKFIFTLYLIVPILVYVLMLVLMRPSYETLEQSLYMAALYFVMASSWVASYPAIYANCPTLVISLMIATQKEGLKREDIVRFLNIGADSKARVEDAVHGRLVYVDGEKLKLTPIGRVIAWVFYAYRRFLGLKGGAQ